MRSVKPSTLALVLVSLATGLWRGGELHGQVIMGCLLDGESLTPIPHGVIHLLNLDTEPLSLAVSDEEGDFTIAAPDSGQFLIRAEAFGYHTLVEGPIPLGLGDTLGVAFYIRADPTLLDPLVVEAERQIRHLEMAGFYRRQRRMVGHFLSREEIEEYKPHDMSSLLLSVPGIILRPARYGRLAPLFQRSLASSSFAGGGRCYPMYFLDGIPMYDAGPEIDFLVHPDNIEAIEAYQSRAETPVEYRDLRAICGVILIWTR